VVDVPGSERLEDFAKALLNVNVAASGQRVACHTPHARIEDHHAANFVQPRRVRQGVLPRAVHALLFATEEHEANRPPRQQSRGLEGARRFDHQRGIAAVVERAGAQVPGIEVRAEDNCFVGLLASTNFAEPRFPAPRRHRSCSAC